MVGTETFTIKEGSLEQGKGGLVERKIAWDHVVEIDDVEIQGHRCLFFLSSIRLTGLTVAWGSLSCQFDVTADKNTSRTTPLFEL